MRQSKLIGIRNKYKKTQEQMAEFLGIQVSTYRRKETGETAFNGDEMFAISELFGEPIEKIFLPRKSVSNRQKILEG